MEREKNRKPTYTELVDSLMVLCRAEKASSQLCEWLSDANGSYDDAVTYFSQLIARTENPVIAMLAKRALAAR